MVKDEEAVDIPAYWNPSTKQKYTWVAYVVNNNVGSNVQAH
jgi:hypothetical protein